MYEIGIETTLVNHILSGKKTIEGRLGKGKFLKIRSGDTLSIREDIWKDGQIVKSVPNRFNVVVKQVLYFESFQEMLSSIDYSQAIPTANSASEALEIY